MNRKQPAWQLAINDEGDQHAYVMDAEKPKQPSNSLLTEDFEVRTVNRLTPVRLHHYTDDGIPVVLLH